LHKDKVSFYYLTMNVLIVGYGSMGKEVEKILLARDHHVVSRVDKKTGVGDTNGITRDLLDKSDAVIEFSLAEAVFDNVNLYAESKTPAVIGTTGWEDQREEIKTIVEEHKSALLYGANFSIGAQLFIRIVKAAARMVNRVPDYDVMMYELHHSNKKDSPSGTAGKIGEEILAAVDRKKRITTERLDRKIEPEELHIGSVRGGSINGIHNVVLDSPADTIELSHSARNRSGFALGTVMAAEWLKNKTGFFTVDDFLEEIF